MRASIAWTLHLAVTLARLAAPELFVRLQLVAALLFSWSTRPKPHLSSRPLLEGAGLLVAVVISCLLVFGKLVAADIIDFSYLLFPVLIWTALRFGPPGASAATAVVSTLAIWRTAHGGGPFVGATFHESVMALQAFMSIVAGTVLVLAAIVAERRRAEQRLFAHDATTRLLAEAATPGDAIPRVLQTICDSLDWDMGVFWRVDREAQVLRYGESWQRPSVEVAGFEAISRAHTFAPDIGLPGRVWASGEPVWIVDVTQDANFPRAPMAAKAGLHGAFAFSLRLGTDILGVMEFFSRESRSPDDELLQMVSTLGSQLGQFLERKQAEEALRDGEERLRLALQAGQMGTWEWNITTGQVKWSETLEAVHGIAPGTFPGTSEAYLSDIHPEDRSSVTEAIAKTLADGSDHCITYRIVLPDGHVRWVEGRGRLFSDDVGRPVRMSGVCMDITERKLAEEQLAASLSEKEVLLKEIHHRVNNNLQIIRSLLSLQSDTIEDPTLRELFHESERRIHAMALVHETLYQATNLARFNLAHYLRTLSTQLFDSYGVDSRRIALTIQVEDLALSLDIAIPCGLILNELLSNAFKHAFPNGQTGEVSVVFEAAPEGHATLRVRDTGVGFPEGLDFRNTNSLGLQLVCALTEQLRGTITLERAGGTTFTLSFPLPEMQARRDESAAGTRPHC